jgi:hypothetical protein
VGSAFHQSWKCKIKSLPSEWEARLPSEWEVRLKKRYYYDINEIYKSTSALNVKGSGGVENRQIDSIRKTREWKNKVSKSPNK